MKAILFIIALFFTFLVKGQENKYSLLEVNNEYIIESDFNVIINEETVVIKPDTYHIHSKKDNQYLLMKNGLIYEMIVKENNLTIKPLNNDSTLVFYKN